MLRDRPRALSAAATGRFRLTGSICGPQPTPAHRPPAPEPADDTEASRPADDVTDFAIAAPSPAPAAVDGSLARFHADIAALNELELSTAGAGLFSGVRSVSGREVHVGTTAAWESLPPIGQQSYIDSLLDYWIAARGGGPAVVRIVDPSGRVLVEKSTP
jgi:hypothetical protein